MKTFVTVLAATSFLWSISTLGAAGTNDVVGNWNGTLNVGSVTLRLVFKINKDPGGGLAATLDSVDQGARNIPVDAATLKGNVLRMEVNAVQGVYEGTLDATGTKAAGLWTQGPQSLPLTLAKGQGNDSASETETLSPADLAASKQAALKLAGTWNGTLAAGPANLRLRLNFSRSSTGTATGTMDSLDQGANGIPLNAIALKDGKLRFEARGIGGLYEGTLGADGTELKGEWRQGGEPLPLEFKKATAN